MAISSGIYGLVGVVTGAAVTGGVQWTIAARTDWLDARVARRRVKAELRTIRVAVTYITLTDTQTDGLVGEDLLDLYFHRLELVRDDLKLDDLLRAYGDRLARHLSDGDWDVLNQAYRTASWLGTIITPGRIPGATQEATDAIDAALKRLA